MRIIQRKSIAVVVAYVEFLVFLHRILRYIERPIDNPLRDSVRSEIMWELENNKISRSIIRMGADAFKTLVSILRQKNLLQDSKYSCVEEQLAKFLWILAHNTTNREVIFFFRRSGETVSRHFHDVLQAIISLEDQFLLQPNGSDIPLEILDDEQRFYPYFQNCVGAIDGTHIRVKVPKKDLPRYRGRKSYPTMNILATCNFDLTYVLTGWEGSASDSRVLENALSREDRLNVPQGKFYLADGGYPIGSSFLTPYRKTRYHLKEYSQRPPTNYRELFNLRHASLRNAAERAFGVLKNRFPIISSGAFSHYPVDIVSEIVLACFILHNFLLVHDPDADFLEEDDQELMDDEGTNECVSRGLDSILGEKLKDSIAAQMWEDY